MVLGLMPTRRRADSTDELYQYFKRKKYKEYWEMLAQMEPEIDLKSYSQEFFEFITDMLKYNYKKRMPIEQVKEHEWFKGPTATPEEVAKELAERRQKID
jgi:serine/threonine protein kinase